MTTIKRYRYYLAHRPPGIGTHPKNAVERNAFDARTEAPISKLKCWGYVEYQSPLDQCELLHYELFEDIPSLPKDVADIVEYARTNGIEQTLLDMREIPEAVKALTSYLKLMGMKTGSMESYRQGLSKVMGV